MLFYSLRCGKFFVDYYLFMKSNFGKLVIFLEFILLAYLIYSLTKNVYQNYKVDQIIEAYRRDNDLIELEIKNKTEEYLYVSSEEYIDKIAKQNLGYVNLGEEVIILSEEVLSESLDGELDGFGLGYSNISIKEQWKNLFFVD